MTQRRIFVCGSHSSGKTTLVRELGKSLCRPIVGEAAREIIAEQKILFENFENDVAAANKFQTDVANRHIKKLEDLPYNAIVDRGPDYLVYQALYSTLSWQPGPELLTLLKESLVLVLEPDEHRFEDDGVRTDVNMLTASKIVFGLQCFFNWHQIPFVSIPAGLTTMERVRLIMGLL